MPAIPSSDQLARDLAVRDLTDPAEGPHAIQLLVELAVRALRATPASRGEEMPLTSTFSGGP